ncbi:BAG family molecular chaperone regulator 1-like [Musa acuminata AAA Group]|uniref:BAG family molecular chaperone regulator 1-like n=1 Tax=Musa acuminata AAA Group TaxID=214697 RepID=UPI0031D935C3
MRSKTGGRTVAFSPIKESPAAAEKAAGWEVRPCGMLVQKRGADADATAAPVPTIRVKVKHGSVYHEIYVSSQATFGELKKALSAKTGLHPLDMKLLYKDKERESTAFLDTAGVKDKSKVVLEEDPTAQAKRLLEMRKTDKMEKATKSISAISLEVDRLASKVSALEAIVNRGGRVVEHDVTNLIESLMNELIKLDAVVADGDVKLQRRMQIKRVQKYVETLDAVKIKNAMPRAKVQPSKEQPQQHPTQPQNQQRHPIQQQKRDSQPTRRPYQQQNLEQPQVVVTTKWETFDSLLFVPSTSTSTAAASSAPHARFDWEPF